MNYKSVYWELKLVFICLIKDILFILLFLKNKIFGRIILNIYISIINSDFLIVIIVYYSIVNIDLFVF